MAVQDATTGQVALHSVVEVRFELSVLLLLARLHVCILLIGCLLLESAVMV